MSTQTVMTQGVCMFSTISRRAFLAVCCSLSIPASAEVFRWVAADGSVHYGDRPAGAEAEKLDISSEANSSPSGLRPGEEARLARIAARRDASVQDRPEGASPETYGQAQLADCERHTRSYEEVRERLRQGYGLGEGTTLRRQLRAARTGMRDHCP